MSSWTRHPGNPIVRVGAPGSNDARFAADPYVLRDRGRCAIYYDGYTARRGTRDLLAPGDTPSHSRRWRSR